MKDKLEALNRRNTVCCNIHQTPLMCLKCFLHFFPPLFKELMSHKEKADNKMFIVRIMG